MKKIKVDHLEHVAIRISYQHTCKVCSKTFTHHEICYRIPIHDSFVACAECSKSFNMKDVRVFWDKNKD